jgi:hypothetical protein
MEPITSLKLILGVSVTYTNLAMLFSEFRAFTLVLLLCYFYYHVVFVFFVYVFCCVLVRTLFVLYLCLCAGFVRGSCDVKTSR